MVAAVNKKGPKSSATAQQPQESEEDIKRREEFEQLVELLQNHDQVVVSDALEKVATELRTATSSMTSVPKPLKYLRPLFGKLADHFDTLLEDVPNKRSFADVLSVLATTAPAADLTGERSMLHYRLQGSGSKDVTTWGQEYLRRLSGEIATVFQQRTSKEQATDDLVELVGCIVPFYMSHNAECDAVDLVCEIDKVQNIKQYVDSSSYYRVVLYLLSIANYAATTDEYTRVLTVAYEILFERNCYTDALRVAIRLGDDALITETIVGCSDSLSKLQIALMCSRHRIHFEFTPENTKPVYKRKMRKKVECNGSMDEGIEEEKVQLTDEEVVRLCVDLNKFICGEELTRYYQLLGKELDVLEPKLPDDVYKKHLEEKRGSGVDSARQNLASTIVNAFVNAGFGTDKLMTVEDSSWLYKNKDHGMLAAAASLGSLFLWNVDEGLAAIDRYQYSQDPYVKAGAYMAFGLISAGVRNECDASYAMLADHIEAEKATERIGAIVGLGFAFGGTCRDDILEAVIPMIIDTTVSLEVSAIAGLVLGLVFAGSCNQEAAEAILQTLMDRQVTTGALDGVMPRFFAVGLALLFLGSRDGCDATVSALEAIEHPLGRYAAVTTEGFAFAGSGDVLKVQKMMQYCVQQVENAKDDDATQMFQAVAVMNISLIAMGEEVGSEMTLRTLDHLLQYADLPQRRAIPLALALHSLSNPRPVVIDTLSKLSHDADADVALHAIIALGLVGAGTNNSRIAGLLRQLAAFYGKDSNAIFVVRLSQGLLYMGKGLMTISPVHSDRFLINRVPLAYILATLHACLHLKNTILGGQHYLLYHIVPAMYPRMLITLDENLEHIQVPVRVGQAVDTIGQAGRPKTVTGFQTHNTPVLLSYSDRAELATEEYISVSSVLEGIVILRPNPHYRPLEASSS